MSKLGAIVLVISELLLVFLAVTILTDSVCKMNGYYNQGVTEEQYLYE